MADGVARLNKDKMEDRIYKLDKDKDGHVADLEIFQQVCRRIHRYKTALQNNCK